MSYEQEQSSKESPDSSKSQTSEGCSTPGSVRRGRCRHVVCTVVRIDHEDRMYKRVCQICGKESWENFKPLKKTDGKFRRR